MRHIHEEVRLNPITRAGDRNMMNCCTQNWTSHTLTASLSSRLPVNQTGTVSGPRIAFIFPKVLTLWGYRGKDKPWPASGLVSCLKRIWRPVRRSCSHSLYGWVVQPWNADTQTHWLCLCATYSTGDEYITITRSCLTLVRCHTDTLQLYASTNQPTHTHSMCVKDSISNYGHTLHFCFLATAMNKCYCNIRTYG